jgi:Ca2+-binding EF-hand superfamily protein
MKEERKDNYSTENFEKIFAQFDTDQNGYLEKAELAVLIKKVFKKSLA